ncbi:MAG: type 1 glutamine amidotransferase domain-containing protein [Bdellovibrionales bacterium]
MNTLSILFIVTSAATMGATPEPTGVWLEELTTPYYEFIDAGYDVTVASVAGGEIPIDPRSTGEDQIKEESVARYLEDKTFQNLIRTTKSAAEIDASKYAAVFFPGGHGTMWDYPNNETLANIITETLDDERIVAAVCHGPAVFVGVLDKNGEPLVKGKTITTFTDSEEEAVGLTDEVPFLLETRLRELGANISIVDNFQPHSVVDGLIVTGQNPASAKPVAADVIKLLKQN